MSLRPLFAAVLLASTAWAAEPGPRTPEQILKSVTLPAGFEATVFASPPQVSYPVQLSAALDGTLFICVDENGSLDRKDHRGKILRVRDTKGEGVADEVKVFAEMDSPRGVIWDGASRPGKGACYVMHPPNLTAYYDDDGDGVADRQEDLITGLGFDLTFRGADHTTNGCRLAIDGFIYVAVGDYGFVEAKGKDGTVIKHRGGGIVRIRPDGTGLELVVEGTRNILDVAVTPTMDIFTRDNTNDGGGWNDRLSFNPPGSHMGYPTLFVNFPEDHVAMLADYGGGAPCGVALARRAEPAERPLHRRVGPQRDLPPQPATKGRRLRADRAEAGRGGVDETHATDRYRCRRRGPALCHELGRGDVQLQWAECGVCAAADEEGRAEGGGAGAGEDDVKRSGQLVAKR